MPARSVSTYNTTEASFYDTSVSGRTANGEKFDVRGLTAAHRTLPFGTKVRVTLVESGLPKSSIVVRINDRGPFAFEDKREIDLTIGAMKALIGEKNLDLGVVSVQLDILELGPNCEVK